MHRPSMYIQRPPGGQILFFDMRIENLALTNLHLHIHEVLLEFEPYICIWSASVASITFFT